MSDCNSGSLFPDSADELDPAAELARQESSINAHTLPERPRKGQRQPDAPERAERAVMRGKRHSRKSLLVAFEERTQIETLKLPFSFTVQTRTVSELNSREFWALKMKRKRCQQQAIIDRLKELGIFETAPMPPCKVKLTRYGRKMDTDNLAGTCKNLRDTIAAWMGVDDGNESIIWDYRQTKGKDKVLIEIESITGADQ